MRLICNKFADMPHRDASLDIFTYILEDEDETLEMIMDLVSELGIKNVRTFNEPDEFVNNLTSNISVAIIDHRLPNGKTGLDIIKDVKNKNKYSYVIIMTGNEDPRVIIQYIKGGANDYVLKGTDMSYLKELKESLKSGLVEAKNRVEFGNWLRERQSGTEALFKQLTQRE